MKRRLLLLGLAGWVGMVGLEAETTNTVSAPVEDVQPVTDPAQVNAAYRQMLTRPEYLETTEPDREAQIREAISRWFSRLGQDFDHFQYAKEMPRFALLIMTVFVGLSLAGLLYVALRMKRKRCERGGTEPSGFANPETLRAPEFYEEEVRIAVAEGRWQAAWLASWRQFLSRLEQSRMVEADRSRTNREYLEQLRAHPLPAGAEELLPRLVDDYDQFIYGKKRIGEPEWRLFQRRVEEAELMLHLRRSAEAVAASA